MTETCYGCRTSRPLVALIKATSVRTGAVRYCCRPGLSPGCLGNVAGSRLSHTIELAAPPETTTLTPEVEAAFARRMGKPWHVVDDA